MITAAFEERFLRLAVDGAGDEVVVRPVPRARARALAAAFLSSALGSDPTVTGQEVVAEAIGAENYARLTGDHVQEFDEAGRYVRTTMPGAVMVEPAEDVPAPEPEQRFRVIPAPWEGAHLRDEEIEVLGLSALLWQTAGEAAVVAFLNPVRTSSHALGLVVARLPRLGLAFTASAPALA